MLKFRKKIFAADLCIISLFLPILLAVGGGTVIKPVIFIVAIYIFIHQVILYQFTRPIGQIIHAIEKQGKYIPLESIKDPEFNKLASTLNSLTEQIQQQVEHLTTQKEETAEILESIEEGIIAVDTSAKITFVNRTACRMLNANSSQMLRQTVQSIPSELAKKCHELILDALQTSESIVHTVTCRDKEIVRLDLIAAPLAHQDGALLVLQDKTADYRIVELGKDFIANASHELRTPITIIRGFAETLQDLPDLSKEMLHEITEKIVRTCVRLDKLVRSLITLSDIENLSQERLRSADLVLLAENCKHHLLAATPSAQIVIRSDCESAPIVADADLLELAILNILENGVKYSSTPAHIEMWIHKTEEEVQLKIQDRGIGMAPADLPHIFNRFYTVDKARSRKSGGAGLGLSIVKTIVEKHKGTISVASEVGKGSTFKIAFGIEKS